MSSPSLQDLLIKAHIQELERSRQTSSTQPIATMSRTAIRRRRRLQLSISIARAIERFVGHQAPEAYAF